MENFNAAGKWIEHEIVRSQQKVKVPGKKKAVVKWINQKFSIDASGKMHKGPTFENYHQLRDIIAKGTAVFAQGVIEHLIAYGLGRPYGFTDDTLAAEIFKASEEGGFKIKTMIEQLVMSSEFQSK